MRILSRTLALMAALSVIPVCASAYSPNLWSSPNTIDATQRPFPVLGNIVTPQSEGAKCDNSTDDTAAFGRALIDAGVNGIVQDLIPGTCLFNALTLSRAGQTFILGPGVTWKQTPGLTNTNLFIINADNIHFIGPGTIDGSSNSSGAIFSAVSGKTGIQLVGLTLKNPGNYVFAGSNNGSMLIADNIIGPCAATFPCIINNLTGAGDSIGPVVRNNRITTVADVAGVQFWTSGGTGFWTGAVFQGNVITLPFPGTNGFDGSILCDRCKGVTILGGTYIGGEFGISIGDADGAVISGVAVSKTNGLAIEIGDTSNALITDYTIDGGGFSGFGVVYDLSIGFVPAPQANLTVGPGTITNFGSNSQGVYFNGQAAAALTNVVASGVNISNMGSGSICVHLARVSNFKVSGLCQNASIGVTVDDSRFGSIDMHFESLSTGVNFFTDAAVTEDYVSITGSMETVATPIGATLGGGGSLGGHITLANVAGLNYSWRDFKNTLLDMFAAGSPNGNVFANIGSTYIRTDGAGANIQCVKTSNASVNSGWKESSDVGTDC